MQERRWARQLNDDAAEAMRAFTIKQFEREIRLLLPRQAMWFGLEETQKIARSIVDDPESYRLPDEVVAVLEQGD